MAFIDAMTRAAKAALAEIEKGNQGSGGTDLTGRVYMDIANEAVWFEVEEDTYHVTNWVSLDFPELAAPGEKAVVATDENHRRDFVRTPPVTYSVYCNEIDNELNTQEALYSGLTRSEAIATANSAREMGEPEKYNYYIGRDDMR